MKSNKAYDLPSTIIALIVAVGLISILVTLTYYLTDIIEYILNTKWK